MQTQSHDAVVQTLLPRKITQYDHRTIEPSQSFTFQEIQLFKNCGAYFICSKGYFPKRFGTYADKHSIVPKTSNQGKSGKRKRINARP